MNSGAQVGIGASIVTLIIGSIALASKTGTAAANSVSVANPTGALSSAFNFTPTPFVKSNEYVEGVDSGCLIKIKELADELKHYREITLPEIERLFKETQKTYTQIASDSTRSDGVKAYNMIKHIFTGVKGDVNQVRVKFDPEYTRYVAFLDLPQGQQQGQQPCDIVGSDGLVQPIGADVGVLKTNVSYIKNQFDTTHRDINSFIDRYIGEIDRMIHGIIVQPTIPTTVIPVTTQPQPQQQGQPQPQQQGQPQAQQQGQQQGKKKYSLTKQQYNRWKDLNTKGNQRNAQENTEFDRLTIIKNTPITGGGDPFLEKYKEQIDSLNELITREVGGSVKIRRSIQSRRRTLKNKKIEKLIKLIGGVLAKQNE
jgi:hypothetical protein